ncbi:MAG: SDR family NAD(P)-dependent oxidoreductase [Mesorhizobium sp.]|nr:MAG: SDR family NAD(P)-dependent oxidoreductase [Mesorhizobium sp.]
MDYGSQFDLAGEVAVVTGGASGIGFAAARALGNCGARIVLLDMNADGLKAAAEALKAAGVASVDARTLDVTDPRQLSYSARSGEEARRGTRSVGNSRRSPRSRGYKVGRAKLSSRTHRHNLIPEKLCRADAEGHASGLSSTGHVAMSRR